MGQFKRCLSCWALTFIIAIPASFASATSAREGIEAAYHKASEAAQLKFLYGILSVRAPGYQGYATNGKLIDPRAERSMLERLITPALAVKETTKIVSLQQHDANHASCQVEDVMEITTIDPAKKSKILLVIESSCTDEWLLTAKGWRQTANRLSRQRFDTRQPPLATPTPTPKDKK